MSDTLFKIKQIVSLVLFIAIISLMGMITSRPVMILAYAGFFIVVIAVMYYLMIKRQRHFELVQGSSKLTNRIIGGVLVALALAAPSLVAFRTSVIKLPSELSFGAAFGMVAGVSVLFLALVFGAIYFINKAGKDLTKRIIGYVLFVIAAIIPGILMSRVDSSTSGIGSVYYVAMAVLILAFNGYGYLTHQD